MNKRWFIISALFGFVLGLSMAPTLVNWYYGYKHDTVKAHCDAIIAEKDITPLVMNSAQLALESFEKPFDGSKANEKLLDRRIRIMVETYAGFFACSNSIYPQNYSLPGDKMEALLYNELTILLFKRVKAAAKQIKTN